MVARAKVGGFGTSPGRSAHVERSKVVGTGRDILFLIMQDVMFEDKRRNSFRPLHVKDKMSDTKLLDEERARLDALHRLDILDTEAEEAFEHVVSLVQTILGVPIAAVSLVDKSRQWFKARRGLSMAETPRSVAFCAHAIQHNAPFRVPDALNDSRFADNPLVLGEPGIRSYAGIPLRTSDGFNIGTLCAIDRKPREFSDADIKTLADLARIVERELELRLIADRDVLTHALTRRAFFLAAEYEIRRFREHRVPCSLVLADLDYFKQINDTYGHVAGDQVLRAAAGLALEVKRPEHLLGRLGGEEFALLLTDVDAQAGLVEVENFRLLLQTKDFSLPGGENVNITASFGIAQISDAFETVEDWLAAADAALYDAKRSGRNQAKIAS